MGYFHVHVIHHHGQVVGGRAVAFQDNQIVQFRVLKGDGALDQVVVHRVAGAGALEAHHRPGRGAQAQFPAGAVIHGFFALGHGLLALFFKGLGRAMAPVGPAFGHHVVDHLAV